MLGTGEKTKNALVSLAIEKALLDTGGSKLLYDVCLELFTNYRSYIADCYENPEYLVKALKVHGENYKVIVASIRAQLEEFSYHKPIERFLNRITR